MYCWNSFVTFHFSAWTFPVHDSVIWLLHWCVSHDDASPLSSCLSLPLSLCLQIENLLEQLKDKEKQLAGLRERVQGLQTDSSNTDTALATLEEALSEKVDNG